MPPGMGGMGGMPPGMGGMM